MRVLWLFCALGVGALGQAPTPLAVLQAEARAHNPGLQAARQQWRAAQAAIAPAGALPDPSVEVQQMSVQVPAPFTGLRGDVMSYIGVGATQELPYPGKLKLRAGVARSQAQTQERQWELAGRQLDQQVADAFIALQQARAVDQVLGQQQQVLAMAEKLAEVHYRTAQGPQADVLAAQLEQTMLLRDLDSNQEMQAAAQAQLRALLNRPAQAPAIVPEPLRATSIQEAAAQLQGALAANPAQAVQRARIAGAETSTALARKNFKPDFSLQYMFEETASGFPDRYGLTLGMTLPWFHRHSRQEPELEQAAAGQLAAQAQLQELTQQQRYQLTAALLEAQNEARILTIDQQGALPQALAAVQAALTAYGNGKTDFNSYLSDWRQALAIEQQYWETLGAHEKALAAVTELTGVKHD